MLIRRWIHLQIKSGQLDTDQKDKAFVILDELNVTPIGLGSEVFLVDQVFILKSFHFQIKAITTTILNQWFLKNCPCVSNLKDNDGKALILDLDGKPQSLHQSEIVLILVMYFVVILLDIGLYCGAKQKKQGLCWLWLGVSTAFLALVFICIIQSFVTRAGMTEVEAIGNETYATLIVHSIIFVGFKGYSIWAVFSYVKQLHHERQGRQQLGLFLSDANVAGVGGKGQAPKVADDSTHSYVAEHQSSHVYQPTSTISKV
ncbi:unnamed protein product [Orchesella dallaii]|uniref:Uncharacterized protein n=1 Tax=Orchesella dallaii TaxID=48710 RepID=A0ABP1QN47_9HEXA